MLNVDKKTARIAGILYLVIIFGSVIGGMLTGLWMEAHQVGSQAGNGFIPEAIYRSGFVIYLLVYLVEVGAAVVLYTLLKPVNKNLALLAALLRTAEAIILAYNMLNQYNAFLLLNRQGLAAVLSSDQVQAMASMYMTAHQSGYLISQVFFGAHCYFLGYLVYKSGYFPRLIGGFLMAACFGYLIESFAYFLVSNYTSAATIAGLISAIPAILAEFAFTYWLLFKGAKIEEQYSQLATSA